MVRQEMKTTNFTERRVEKSVTKRPNTKMRVLKNLFTEIYTHTHTEPSTTISIQLNGFSQPEHPRNQHPVPHNITRLPTNPVPSSSHQLFGTEV